MMRSLSTSALGQPSETKLTFGACAAGRPASGFSMGQGLAERGRARKRAKLEPGHAALRRNKAGHGDLARTLRKAGPGEGIAGAPALPSAQVSSGGASGNAIRSVLGRDFGSGGSPF